MNSGPRIVQFSSKMSLDLNQNEDNDDDVEIFEVIEFSTITKANLVAATTYASDSDEVEILDVPKPSCSKKVDVITISEEEEEVEQPRKISRSTAETSPVEVVGCKQCPFTATSETLIQQHTASSHQPKASSPQPTAPAKKRNYTPRKTPRRKSKNQIPRLAENMNLVNLNLIHKNGFWKITRNSQLQRKKHKCSRCLLSFATIEELSQHFAESFSPDNLFVCAVCRERKATKEDLYQHLGYHHAPKRLRCLLCKKLTEYCIVKHQDYIYSIEDKQYDCMVCFKEFCTMRNLRKHMRHHSSP